MGFELPISLHPFSWGKEVPFELELIGYFFTFFGMIVEDKSILSLPSLQELQRPCPFFLNFKKLFLRAKELDSQAVLKETNQALS